MFTNCLKISQALNSSLIVILIKSQCFFVLEKYKLNQCSTIIKLILNLESTHYLLQNCTFEFFNRKKYNQNLIKNVQIVVAEGKLCCIVL